MFNLIKQNVNIVRHIEKYVPLKQAGRIMKACCPFHKEDTPSFVVYPEGHWWCFGQCNCGGTVIDFEMVRLQASAVEAARLLCAEYNLHPSPADAERFHKTMQLRKEKEEWLEEIKDSFNNCKDIYNYVHNRGISDETIKEFKLGASDKANALIIPINDRFGKIAGFAKRNLDKNALAKYVNDSSDGLYNKSEILYGFDKAKAHIREDNAIVLNEGYFDTWTLVEAGIKHSVAWCSATLTKEQGRLLSDTIDENCVVYLVPTNDETAQENLQKNMATIAVHCPKNHIRVLVVPDDCKDLNDVLMKWGKAKIDDIYRSSIPAELYLVKRILHVEPLLEAQYNRVKNLCAKITNAMILEDICEFLAEAWKKKLETVHAFLFGKQVETVNTSSIKTMDMLIVEYDTYIEELKDNRILYGWPKTDKITRGMRIGDSVLFMASSGTGKTLWAENLILNLTQNYPTNPILFFSLEQLGIMAFERFMMMKGELTSVEVEKWHHNSEIEVQRRILKTMYDLSANCKSFALIDEGAMTLQKIENFMVQAGMSMFNQPVKVVIVDYLGYVQGEGKDAYHRLSDIAKQLKELAKRQRCIAISLHQVNKAGKSGGEPVETYFSRDSNVVIESADTIITAYRPELKEGLSEAERKVLNGIFKTEIKKNKYGMNNIPVEFHFEKKYLKLSEKDDVPFEGQKIGGL
jgi:DNA primase